MSLLNARRPWRHALVAERQRRRRAISDLALIGDGNCAALMDREGSRLGCAGPASNSQAIFAGLLGGEDNGEWRIAPVQPFQTTRRYRPDTLILETCFATAEGSALLTDFMPYQTGPRAIMRRLRGMRGRATMTMRFAPRVNYGCSRPRYRREHDRLAIACEGLALAFEATRPELARAEDAISFELREGETIDFVLTDNSSAPTDSARM